MTIQTMTLGYARMGKRQEVKKALEAYWGGNADADIMLSEVVPSLKAMVAAVQQVREDIHATSR
jgi:hypothetical protein